MISLDWRVRLKSIKSNVACFITGWSNQLFLNLREIVDCYHHWIKIIALYKKGTDNSAGRMVRSVLEAQVDVQIVYVTFCFLLMTCWLIFFTYIGIWWWYGYYRKKSIWRENCIYTWGSIKWVSHFRSRANSCFLY